jgi:16S rRNA (uracil1498-N3)-methyltransferase
MMRVGQGVTGRTPFSYGNAAMREYRIFVDLPLAEGQRLSLPADAVHRVTAVLRLRPGDELRLFSGDGASHAARILSTARGEVLVETGLRRPGRLESPLSITLAQGISRGQKMDYTLQKAVELGVARLVPLLTDHGNVRLDGERAAARMRHWRNVIIGACEQCGRDRLPELHPPVPFREWIDECEPRGTLLLDPDGEQGLAAIHPAPTALCLLSGPEGGFSPEEIDFARTRGCVVVRLGPRVLRTETAAVAALAACQALWGDLG